MLFRCVCNTFMCVIVYSCRLSLLIYGIISKTVLSLMWFNATADVDEQVTEKVFERERE